MLLLLLLACHPGAVDSTAPAQGAIPGFVTDGQGRALILHGMNVMGSSKHTEDRMPPMDEAVVQRMASDWGFNLSRFLIFWDHVEPEAGAVDQAYLDLVEERLDWHARAGVFVVLDMHQDVYAERFCCDGAPGWAIRDDGEPFEQQSAWYLNYFQPAVERCFDNFFAGDDGAHPDVQAHYVAAWAEVAARFRDHPAVLGYDLMNEPSPGSANDPVELLGRQNPDGTHPAFDRERLTPFHQRVIEAIRAEDPDGWIFFEPRYGAPANGLPSYHGPLADPREGEPRLAYFPHLYSLLLEARQRYDPATDTAIPDWEAARTAEAGDQPLLIGEWGFDPSWENATQALLDVLAMADRATSGWAYWSLDPGGWGPVDAHWNERESADVLVRPYPRAVAGRPLQYGYDPTARRFWLEWEDWPGVAGLTEIYLPAARHYPAGWELQADGGIRTKWDPGREILLVEAPPSEAPHRIEVTPAD